MEIVHASLFHEMNVDGDEVLLSFIKGKNIIKVVQMTYALYSKPEAIW